jgi:hypothetical protein
MVVMRDGASEAVETHDQLLRESDRRALVHRQTGGLLLAA